MVFQIAHRNHVVHQGSGDTDLAHVQGPVGNHLLHLDKDNSPVVFHGLGRLEGLQVAGLLLQGDVSLLVGVGSPE